MKEIALLVALSLSSSIAFAGSLIPYKIIEKNRMSTIKASYDIQVDLVRDSETGKMRLPNEAEIGSISKEITRKEKAKTVFVGFYLPEMKKNAGYYATAHHNPKMEVNIMEFMLMNTKYDKYIKD